MFPSSATNIYNKMVCGLDTSVEASSRKTRGSSHGSTARLKLEQEKKQNKFKDNIIIITHLILQLKIQCPHPSPPYALTLP